MTNLYITIPLQPITKKNSSVIITNPATGRPMIIPSEAYRKYEKAAKPFLTQYQGLAINEKLNVKAIYYMQTKRKVDLCNLHAALHDILVKYNILEDDNCNIIVSTDNSRVCYDKANPRTELWITTIVDEET